MEAALPLVLLAVACYAGRLLVRLIAYRSFLVPQISFLACEVQRLSEQADDEYLASICVRERVQGLQARLGSLRGRADRLRDRLSEEQDKSRRLQTAVDRQSAFQSRRVLVP